VRKNDRYAKLAASRLRQSWRDARARLGAAPRQSVAAAEQALRSRRRRRMVARLAIPVLASSVAVGGLTLVWLSFGPGARRAAPANDNQPLFLFAAPGRDRPAPDSDRRLGSGDRLRAPELGALVLGDAAGTQLTVEASASLTVLEAGATRRFALSQGAVGARVRKLQAGQRFIIQTPDAEVEVHGTAFRVALDEPEMVPCTGAGPRQRIATRVMVTEGVVSVKWAGAEQRLLPGADWPPRCSEEAERSRPTPVALAAAEAPPLPAPTSRHPAAASTRRRPGAGSAAVARDRAPDREPPASLLEAQNNLFVSAVRARHGGRATQARALFEQFLQRYPEASLFESALAQKMRVEAALSDRAAAGATARRYLARFPDGFAQQEARALLDASERR